MQYDIIVDDAAYKYYFRITRSFPVGTPRWMVEDFAAAFLDSYINDPPPVTELVVDPLFEPGL